MYAHEFHLFFIVLLDHLSVNGVLLFCDAHLRALFEEFAGEGVAKGEVRATELEVAPDLEVFELVYPGCSQGLAD